MRVQPDDPAARVEFVFRGDPDGKFTLPIEARPRTWVRGLNIGGVAAVASGAALAGPAALAAPGPVGVVLTGFGAVAFGVTAALTVGPVLAAHDTPETPVLDRLRRVRAEARTPRPTPPTTVESSLEGVWPVYATTESRIDPTLWSSCVHPDCVAPPDPEASEPPHHPDGDPGDVQADGGVRGPRERHRRPRRHVRVLRPRRLRA